MREVDTMAVFYEDLVNIELNNGTILRSFTSRAIGTGDSAANRFGVRVLRNGKAVSLSGCTCEGFFRNAAGENIALTAHGTVDGNEAYVTLPQACYAVEGQFCLSIKLIGGGVTGTMRIVDGVVSNTNTENPVAPTAAIPTYQEILAVYDEMQEAVETAEGFEDAVRNIAAGKDGAEYEVDTGKYVNRATGNINLYEDYVTATDGESNKIAIPAGCTKILLKNFVFKSGTPAMGWAVYDSSQDFIRGGSADEISIEDGDVYFAFCSYSPSTAVITELDAEFLFGVQQEEIERIETEINAVQRASDTITLNATVNKYVNYATGAIATTPNDAYSATAATTIPAGCARIEFPGANINVYGYDGWATYKNGVYSRGGQTLYIDVEDGEDSFAVSSYNTDGAFNALDVKFIYYNIGKEIYRVEKKATASESVILPATVNKFVNYLTGARQTITSGKYSATGRIFIHDDCKRISFPDVVMVPGGSAGWATYKNDVFSRGGQTLHIDLEEGEDSFAVSTYGADGAPESIKITYNYDITAEDNNLAKALTNEGYKIVMLGDSIIGNFDGEDSIPGYLSWMTGAECVNCGLGGTSMGSDLVSPDEYLEAFNGWKIIQAITDDDWSAMDEAIEGDPEYEHLKPYFASRIQTLKDMDWTKVDILTMSYGTNDWGTKVVLDDEEDEYNTDTFGGAYRTALETLWAKYPNIKVMIFGVIWRGISISGGQITGDSDDGKHGRNWYLREFEEKAGEICQQYHVPFVPMYDYTNFNRYTWTAYFGPTDATHPKAEGRYVMARRYASFIRQL